MAKVTTLDWDCPDCGTRNDPLAVMCQECYCDAPPLPIPPSDELAERRAVRALDPDPVDYDED